MSILTKEEFTKTFAADIKALKAAEKVTKEKLLNISRYMLEQIHHVDCDIRPVNTLLAVLTPMNKRTAVLFFKEFSGFKHDADTAAFTEKNKKTYEDTKAKAIDFLDDPHNNIWTWADRNIEMDVKPVDFKRLTKAVETTLKKAKQEGIANPELQVIKAVLDGGITTDTLLALLSDMDVINVETTPAVESN